jgi:hypothetical protein
MGRYAIITDPLAGTPMVLMICDTRTEADAILDDLHQSGASLVVHELPDTLGVKAKRRDLDVIEEPNPWPA